jgi:Ca2+-dependent lipid-binding protein
LKGESKYEFTKTIKGSRNPIFMETFVFEPKNARTDILVMKLYNSQRGNNILLGEVELPVSTWLDRKSDEWMQWKNKRDANLFVPGKGFVHLQLQYGVPLENLHASREF